MKAKETVAVIGASARAAAFSLLRAGYQVVAADLFSDADLAKFCDATQIKPYPEGFEAWLAKTECDGWFYTGALENYPELVDCLADMRPLFGHSGKSLRRVRDPLQLQTVLNATGLDFPETKPANSARPRDETWLGKTYRGSSGSGVDTAEPLYWQRRIEGLLSLSAVFRGPQLLGVTRQLVGEEWLGAARYKYCGSIGPWPLSAEHQQQVHCLGEVLSQEFDLTNLYGVDFIFDGKRIWILEVNPRYTAAVEIVECAYGISAFCDPIAPSALANRKHLTYGKAILFAKVPIAITEETSARLLKQAGELVWPCVADIPRANTEIDIGQPVLTVFTQAENLAEVMPKLEQRIQEIELQLYGHVRSR